MRAKRIILTAKAASGKDYLRSKLEKRGFVSHLSITTRPPRLGEIDGKDYNFVSTEKFEAMIANNIFYEYKNFNGWYYGTLNSEWYTKDIFIFTPGGVALIKEEDRKQCFIIYLDIPYDVRLERLKQRSDADSVERRIKADEEDFKDFINYDLRITNPNF